MINPENKTIKSIAGHIISGMISKLYKSTGKTINININAYMTKPVCKVFNSLGVNLRHLNLIFCNSSEVAIAPKGATTLLFANRAKIKLESTTDDSSVNAPINSLPVSLKTLSANGISAINGAPAKAKAKKSNIKFLDVLILYLLV